VAARELVTTIVAEPDVEALRGEPVCGCQLISVGDKEIGRCHESMLEKYCGRLASEKPGSPGCGRGSHPEHLEDVTIFGNYFVLLAIEVSFLYKIAELVIIT